MDVPPVPPPGGSKPARAARYISATRCTEFMERTGPARWAAPSHMAAFACTTPTSSTYLRRYRSAPTVTWCREFYKVAVSWPPLVLKLWMRARSDLIELVTVLRPTSRNDHASKDL